MANESDRTVTRTDGDHPPERFVAEILLNRRRRYVLYYLTEHRGPVCVKELARQVTAWERSPTTDEGERSEATTAHGQAVSSAIRRRHLPYLEARGFVTYDSHSDSVTGHVDDSTVELFVANHPQTTVGWHKVFLALTVISSILLGLTQIGVPAFRDIRPLTTAALIVILFAVASLGYWYDVRRWRRRNEKNPPDFLVSVDEELPDEEGEGGPNEGGRS